MKIIKRFIIVAIMMVLLAGLTGCGDSKNNISSTSDNNTTKANTTKTNTTSSNTIDVTKYDFLSAAKAQVAEPTNGETIAIFHIKNYGNIKVKLFKDVAPKAVENFTSLAKDGYYNGVSFHRVINYFMIQCGDRTVTGRGGQSVWGKAFEDEFDYSLVPYRGALCMANSGSNTNGSQFFIEQAKYDEKTYTLLRNNGYPDNLLEAYKQYGGSMHLFGAHTVFGQVIEGMDVVDKIAACETDENDKPLQDVVIESIEVAEF